MPLVLEFFGGGGGGPLLWLAEKRHISNFSIDLFIREYAFKERFPFCTKTVSKYSRLWPSLSICNHYIKHVKTLSMFQFEQNNFLLNSY